MNHLSASSKDPEGIREGLEGSTIKEIDCESCKLTSLDGLKGCKQLETLMCCGNEIENIKGLNDCTSLGELARESNPIVTLERLRSKGLRPVRDCLIV